LPSDATGGGDFKRAKDSASAEAKLTACCAELRELAKKYASDTSASSGPQVVAALVSISIRLASVSVDAELLRRTGVAKEVNQRWIRTHTNEDVRRASSELVHSWKNVVVRVLSPGPKPSRVGDASSPPAPARGAPAPEAQVPPPKAPPEAPVPAEGAASIGDAAAGSGACAAEDSGKEWADAAKTQDTETTKEKKDKKDRKDKKDKKENKEQKVDMGRLDAAKTQATGTTKEKKDKDKKDKKDKDTGKTKGDALAGAEGSANAELSEFFKELSVFEFKLKARFKGMAYKKVAALLAEVPEKVTSSAQVKDTSGIGPASLKKIEEYLETGKIQKLEKYRRGEFDGAE